MARPAMPAWSPRWKARAAQARPASQNMPARTWRRLEAEGGGWRLEQAVSLLWRWRRVLGGDLAEASGPGST